MLRLTDQRSRLMCDKPQFHSLRYVPPGQFVLLPVLKIPDVRSAKRAPLDTRSKSLYIADSSRE